MLVHQEDNCGAGTTKSFHSGRQIVCAVPRVHPELHQAVGGLGAAISSANNGDFNWWKMGITPEITSPICSMYGICTYMWVIFRATVGKYSIHGAYGSG